MCNYCLISQNELPVLLLLPSPATSQESFPYVESSFPLISINQNSASSEVGISCFPELEVIGPWSVLLEHLVQIFVCVCFFFVVVVVWLGFLKHRSHFGSYCAHWCACFNCSNPSWAPGRQDTATFLFAAPLVPALHVHGAEGTWYSGWSYGDSPCLPASLPCVFVYFTYGFSFSNH